MDQLIWIEIIPINLSNSFQFRCVICGFYKEIVFIYCNIFFFNKLFKEIIWRENMDYIVEISKV